METKYYTDTKNVVIANGAAVSNSTELGAFRSFSIQMPAAWTAASLTFQGSIDGTTFYDVYDIAGNELVVTAAASRIIVDIPELSTLRYLKVRSGTTGTPVNQGAERTLTIICKG